MAYIPSDQRLRAHPKVRKAARLLNISIPLLIGHLHLLWHWAIDYAQDGDLSHFDDAEIAGAALYEGDPAAFVAALVECGTGGKAGFVDPGRVLHDWHDYGGKLFVARERNAGRMRDFRARAAPAPPPERAAPAPAPDPPPPPEPRPKRAGKARDDPQEFVPGDAERAWLAGKRFPAALDVAAETEKFNNYRQAHRPAWKSIPHAWRNWLLRAAEDLTRPAGGAAGARRPAASVAATSFDAEKYRRMYGGVAPTKES